MEEKHPNEIKREARCIYCGHPFMASKDDVMFGKLKCGSCGKDMSAAIFPKIDTGDK